MPTRVCLLVDDDAICAAYVRELLHRHAVALLHAQSLTAADAQLAAGWPELLIVDRQLPDGDGLAWLARRLGEFADPVRCLLCSGDRLAPDALPAGVQALRKPLDADALIAWLDAHAWREATDAKEEGDALPAVLDDAVASTKFGGNLAALHTLRRMFLAELDAAPAPGELAAAMRPDYLHRWRAAAALTGCARVALACARAEAALGSDPATLAARLDALAGEIAAIREAIGP